MAAEHIKKWQIGDVEIVRIVEVNAHEDPFTMLSEDLTPEIAKQHRWLMPHFATPEGRMKISFQAFALRSGKERVMIDTCIGNDREREYPIFTNMQTSFLEDLKTAGYPRESITKVLCTHLHFDHVGWNTMKVNGRFVPTFPHARYLFGRKEYDHWQMLKRTGGYHDFSHLVDSVDPITDADLADFIEPSTNITDEVSLVPTPGHTPGHVSVMIKSRGAEAIITGDMMHHPIQFAESDRTGNFDMDKEQGVKTRKEMFKRLEDRDILVIGSHFCNPSSGYVVRDKNNWRLKVVE
ncbi:MAG TPA: MBL fold metallo-hydrolase [Rhizomicrobium sp.]|nr:MBL fold metallo-hydrolase [Rhizomicrobium sp.]